MSAKHVPPFLFLYFKYVCEVGDAILGHLFLWFYKGWRRDHRCVVPEYRRGVRRGFLRDGRWSRRGSPLGTHHFHHLWIRGGFIGVVWVALLWGLLCWVCRRFGLCRGLDGWRVRTTVVVQRRSYQIIYCESLMAVWTDLSSPFLSMTVLPLCCTGWRTAVILKVRLPMERLRLVIMAASMDQVPPTWPLPVSVISDVAFFFAGTFVGFGKDYWLHKGSRDFCSLTHRSSSFLLLLL